MKPLRLLAATLLALPLLAGTVAPALAQDTGDDSVQPDVTVRQEEDRTIREYRVNGQLYAIEIKPKHGPSYYLVDDNGDGDFHRSDAQRVVPPQWVLISW